MFNFLKKTASLQDAIDILIKTALYEDRVTEDITSLACVDKKDISNAIMILKENACICALNFLPRIFKAIDPKIKVELLAKDGDFLSPGPIARISGKTSDILSGERTSLNILQHASGIATTTSKYVNAVKKYKCDILDTRKTPPGLRVLQKYAVKIGGGKNHRFNLAECVLIKDNHIYNLQNKCQDPILEAISRVRKKYPQKPIIIEVEDLGMLDKALSAGSEHIMLDNMNLDLISEAVKITNKRAYLEVSGGVNLTTVEDIAKTGIDGISVGALTHSVKSIDISIDLE